MGYNWQLEDRPNFTYDLGEIEDKLFEFAELTGHTNGIIKTLPEEIRVEAIINIMVSEAIKPLK